jgi:CHASE3 domain sensor protein
MNKLPLLPVFLIKHAVPPIKLVRYASKYIYSFLLLMFCLFIFIACLSKRNIDKLKANFDEISITQSVITLITEIESMSKDLVTGQRGYLLTHDEKYLEVFTESKLNIGYLVDQLALMTADNPAQLQNVADLATVITRSKAFLISKIVQPNAIT